MPILVHFKAKNNDNSYFYKNSGLSFQWVPYYVNWEMTVTVKPVLSGHTKIRQKEDLNDKWQLNEYRKYCKMLHLEHSALQGKHSAILSTCMKR